jgi:transcriptional regulator with XRE-family HTH domain
MAMNTKFKANEIDVEIGKRLRSRRKFLKLSQRDLGQEIGITFQQIQKYENGKNKLSASRLIEFAKVLKTDINYFYSELGEVTNEEQHFVCIDKETFKFLSDYKALDNDEARAIFANLIKSLPKSA